MVRKVLIILAAVMASFATAAAQDLKITGTVTDQTGYPLEGATVLVRGTTKGTTTDAEGRYMLNATQDAEIVVSYLGYLSQSKKADGKSQLDFVLMEDTNFLDDVIVVAYGTMSESDFTGSASQIKGEEIATASKESIDKGMMGKIAGVRISSDNGDPGSAGSVQIRGVGSISAGTSPLYVIDGTVISSATEGDIQVGYRSTGILNTLNPDDIESVTVLKDAAAASLYGSRAANGVILITTKRGRQGRTSISYSGEAGVSSMAVGKALQLLDGPKFIRYIKDAADNAYAMNPAYSYGYDGDTWASWVADPSGKTSTDWTRQVFRNAFRHSHQLSLSAGNEKTRVYSGLGYSRTDGIVLGSYFDRISGRINIDHQINDRLKVGLRQMVSFTGSRGHNDQSDQSQGMGYATPIGVLTQSDPTATPENPDGTWNENVSWSGFTTNPHLLFDSDMQYNKARSMRSLSNIDIELSLTDALSVKNTFGYDYLDNKQYLWWSPASIDGESMNGLSASYIFQTDDLTNSTVLRYSDTFGSGHNLSALAGFEVADHRSSFTYAAANNYPGDKLTALSVGQMYGVGGASYRSFMLSVLANVNYDWEHRYYASASFRRDGSSRLGPDSRWANFWSVSGAWRISEEEFLRGSDIFSDVKIKASYGTNGNLPSAYYAYKGLYSASGGYGTEAALWWSNPRNDSLGWEKSRNFNVGFDWYMYNRVNLNVEYYHKYTSSLIFDMPASAVTGFSSYTSNIGNLLNNGLEIEISSRNFERENFTWDTSLNLTFQKSVVKSLPNDNADISYGDGGMYIHRVGESMYSFYLPVWKGVNPETGLGEFLIDPEDPSKGVTNWYSEAASTIAGKAIPDLTGGITNTFTFLGGMIDLSILITFQTGGSLFDYPGYFTHSDGFRAASMNAAADASDYWTPANRNAAYPKPIMNNPYRWDRFSSRLIHSTDNIRMRELTMGCNIPVKRYLSGLRLYFKATNPLMIWSATPDIDPDVAINGYRTADVPAVKAFVMGMNITL
jgi:TonB-linked SusC/RagA family outer membrane protein